MLKLNIDVDGMHKDLFVKFYDDINDYFKYIGISEKVKIVLHIIKMVKRMSKITLKIMYTVM